jgi:hypothetical protein
MRVIPNIALHMRRSNAAHTYPKQELRNVCMETDCKAWQENEFFVLLTLNAV